MHIYFSERRHILPYKTEGEAKTEFFTLVNQLEDIFFMSHIHLMNVMKDFLQQNYYFGHFIWNFVDIKCYLDKLNFVDIVSLLDETYYATYNILYKKVSKKNSGRHVFFIRLDVSRLLKKTSSALLKVYWRFSYSSTLFINFIISATRFLCTLTFYLQMFQSNRFHEDNMMVFLTEAGHVW